MLSCCRAGSRGQWFLTVSCGVSLSAVSLEIPLLNTTLEFETAELL